MDFKESKISIWGLVYLNLVGESNGMSIEIERLEISFPLTLEALLSSIVTNFSELVYILTLLEFYESCFGNSLIIPLLLTSGDLFDSFSSSTSSRVLLLRMYELGETIPLAIAYAKFKLFSLAPVGDKTNFNVSLLIDLLKLLWRPNSNVLSFPKLSIFIEGRFFDLNPN